MKLFSVLKWDNLTSSQLSETEAYNFSVCAAILRGDSHMKVQKCKLQYLVSLRDRMPISLTRHVLLRVVPEEIMKADH